MILHRFTYVWLKITKNAMENVYFQLLIRYFKSIWIWKWNISIFQLNIFNAVGMKWQFAFFLVLVVVLLKNQSLHKHIEITSSLYSFSLQYESSLSSTNGLSMNLIHQRDNNCLLMFILIVSEYSISNGIIFLST